MTEASFRQIVGTKAAARRRELGVSQEEVAVHCGLLGFAATRSVIASIERGTRELELPELLALLAVLDLSLQELLESADRVAVDRGLVIETRALRKQLAPPEDAEVASAWQVQSGKRTFTVIPSSGVVAGRGAAGAMKAFLGSLDEMELKFARKIGVEPEAVVDIARDLWGKTLKDERDARVAERLPAEASSRTLQALRGHVTRALIQEMAEALDKKGRR